MEVKKKGDKVNRLFSSEEDIFDFLGLEYKSPIERIDGRAIVHKSNNNVIANVNTNVIAEDFKKRGISVLVELNESQLALLLREANKAYYNNTPFFTDSQYDIVKEYVETNYPSNKVIYEIGSSVERNKAILPYLMGSMNKIKPDTHALANWSAKYKGPFVVSCKLDGVSGLYTTEGEEPKLYTRGDGRVGQDISHLIPFLRLPKTDNLVIRGEIIIPKAIFESKYKGVFANPRNMVSGIVNHKTINDAIKDLHFVAYELITPIYKPSNQLQFLSTLDVEVVMHKLEHTLTNELLSQRLVDWRHNYAYEIDGVIVANDKVYERKSYNPEHAFAFKMVLSDQIAESKVVDVIWSPSKDGYLKPRVEIEPINLGGVYITYATGFNGAFIRDNKIGVGAVVEIIRSGDVIPYIRKVIVAADEAKMPLYPFNWNNTHIDVVLEDMELNETVKEKNITGFFRGIDVEGLSNGNIKRIMEAGYDSVPKILRMEIPDFLKVHGFKEKTAAKLYHGIKEKVESASLTAIMAGSNMLGRGFSEKKIELIMEAYPTVLVSKESDTQKIAKICAIKGMAAKSAEVFVERIPEFIRFMKEAGLVTKLSQPKKEVANQTHPLFGKSIVLTGFRDDELTNKLKEMGAKNGSSVSSKTFVVLVKDKHENTGKADEARKLGIPLMTLEEFNKTYFFN